MQFHAIGNPELAKRPDGGKTAADGSFKVPVHGPGEFAITVFWPSVTTVDGELTEGKDQFEGRHHNPKQPVRKVTIQEGVNIIPTINLDPQ